MFPTLFQSEPVENIVNLHSMLFSLQYASAKSWIDCGLEVDTIVGHSFGQLTGLVVAGVLSLSEGLRLVSGRARLIQECWGEETGAMLSVEGEEIEVSNLLETAKQQYPAVSAEIACYNGRKTFVLAGSCESIDSIKKVSDSFANKLKTVKLGNSHAFHSRLVDSIVPGLRQVAQSLGFKKPSIHIEGCSKDKEWGQTIDAEKIVRHTREPVHFVDAVERIAGRLEPAIWLEAGSASPVIPMARRVLENARPGNNHTLQSIDLRGSDAMEKLSKATCNVWAAGSDVQFWPFHRSQKNDYNWVNLPPYQFQETSHWLEYKTPDPVIISQPAPSEQVQENKKDALLTLLERNPGDALFGVDCANDLFKMCAEGHAVLKQSLCPASMYFEMAIQASMLLTEDNAQSSIPQIADLKIRSPLSCSPDRSLFIQLDGSQEDESWGFTVFSRSQHGAANSTQHAAGTVSLSPSADNKRSGLQSFNRLVNRTRYEDFVNSAGSNSLNGKVIYQAFGQVVKYAPYFQGVNDIVSKGNEAMSHVSLPDSQPPALRENRCDPIMLDNFLQVAGIHVNCLTERDEKEAFVCIEIGDLIMTEAFLEKQEGVRSWTVYSTFERHDGGCVMNDVFVSDAKTKKLVCIIMGAKFRGVPMASLAKALANINGASKRVDNTISSPKSSKATGNHASPPSKKSAVGSTSTPARRTNNLQSNSEHERKVREMVSEILDVPLKEIRPGSSLVDLGVDSLISTEILNEGRKRFGVTISASKFQAAEDVQSLACQLRVPGQSSQNAMPEVPSKATRSLDTQPQSQADGPSLSQVKQMLSDLLDAPMSEIKPETSLVDLGVDSLMVTEFLSEIKKRFDVTISTSEFQDVQNVSALLGRLTPPSSEPAPARSDRAEDSTSESDSEQSDYPSTPASELSTIDETEKPSVGDLKTEAFSSVGAQSFGKVQRSFDAIAEETKFAGFCNSVYPAQIELVLAYVVDAFTSLGCPLASLAAGEELPDISVLSKHTKVKAQLYRILEDQGVAERDAGTGKFLRSHVPIAGHQASVLGDAIIDRFPQHSSEHKLLRSTGSKLAECLTGGADPLAILFGNAEARSLMEDVYTNAPMFKSGTINLAQYLVDIFRRSGGSRPIRILELGAGTGGTTKHLIESLIGLSQEFEYTFTDLSPSLIAAARRKFSKYNFMRYAVMDIEVEPKAEFRSQYDIVISTNCIHATRDLTRSCTNINKLLHPDGILCLVELTRNLFWFDLVFGLLEGWWLFDDGRQHALAHEELWKQQLSNSGYNWVDWTAGETGESQILRVITASPSSVPVEQQTVVFKQEEGISLQADIYYPEEVSDSPRALPVGEF